MFNLSQFYTDLIKGLNSLQKSCITTKDFVNDIKVPNMFLLVFQLKFHDVVVLEHAHDECIGVAVEAQCCWLS